MGKAIGGTIGGAVGIDEAIKKRKDGKKFIAQANAKQRAFEEASTSSNSFGMIKASTAAYDLATENIQLSEAAALDTAAGAGIRGIGMINQINRNTNAALASEAAKLAEKQSQIDVAKAGQEERNVTRALSQSNLKQERIDSMLERGQALRSQGSGELSQNIQNIGETVDQGFKDAASFISGGGFSGLGFGKTAKSTLNFDPNKIPE